MIAAPVAGPELRDIHVPVASWWPLAPAWWVLAAVSLAALVVAALYLRRWLRRRGYWHVLRKELDVLATRHARDGDAAGLAAGMSQLLRRTARHMGGAVQLDGKAWRAEIERLQPGALEPALLPVVDGVAYRPQADFDAPAALAACARWLRRATERF
jgi:hypothetical protein